MIDAKYFQEHDIPDWLWACMDKEFIDMTGKQTYESLPDEMGNPNNLILFHYVHALAQIGAMESKNDYDLFMSHILPEYTKELTKVLKSLAHELYNDFTALKASRCTLCNQSLITDIVLAVCEQCKRQHAGEAQTVRSNLLRAKKARTDATLTLPEWIATLQRFNYRCAYCEEGSYEVLEHYIPISQNGGTVQENCMPACRKCNAQKSGKHPELTAR